jgi:hypothetical protein
MHKNFRLLASHRAAACLLAVACMAGAHAAPAPAFELSLTAQPNRYVIHAAPYVIAGHGRARFGQSMAEVRAIVAADLPGAATALRDTPGGDPLLTVVAPRLAPGPGPATLHYLFGRRDRRLVGVDVTWATEGPVTPAQRAELVEAARTAASAFSGWQWPPLATSSGHVLPDGVLIVFSGHDAGGAGVEVRLDGVDLDIEPHAATASAPASVAERRVPKPGRARLRLKFLAADAAAETTPATPPAAVPALPDGAF